MFAGEGEPALSADAGNTELSPKALLLSKLNGELLGQVPYFKKLCFSKSRVLWGKLQAMTIFPPPFPLTLKSRAICARSLPPLLVAYACTAPPSLQSRTHPPGPIHRVSIPRLVCSTEVSLPPGTEIRNCIPLIKFPVPAASQAGRQRLAFPCFFFGITCLSPFFHLASFALFAREYLLPFPFDLCALAPLC